MHAHKLEKNLQKQKLQKVISSNGEQVELAIEAIKIRDFFIARKILKEIVAIDMEDPKAYNLLGIIYEKEGNNQSASKCYRVAYSMDQTFLAASNNLDRVCSFYQKAASKIDWGIEIEEIKE